jgi:hypothetical protein
VVEDIDDLSDADKVSLISDIEFNQETSTKPNLLGLKDTNMIN